MRERSSISTVALVTALVTTACGGTKPTVVAAPPPETVPVKYLPLSATYFHVSHRNVSQTETTDLEIGIRYRTSVMLQQDGDGFAASFTIDSIAEAWGPGIEGGSSTALGRTILGSVDSTGAIDLETDANEDDAVLVFLINDLQHFFPVLPPGGALPAQVWVDTSVTDVVQPDAELVLTSVNTYRAQTWENRRDSFLLPVQWNGEISISGVGEQFGQTYTVEAKGSITGQALFSVDGVLFEVIRTGGWDGYITVISSGFEVPLSQTSADTVRMVSKW